MTQVDEDVDGARRIHREASPRQPQQVDVVASPFCLSLLEDNSNGIFGLPAFIPAIDRYLSHRCLLFSSFFNLQVQAFSFSDTIILPASLRYRLLSETRGDVCPILGPVFVLWVRASPLTDEPWSRTGLQVASNNRSGFSHRSHNPAKANQGPHGL
jgi:hypothetical protein